MRLAEYIGEATAYDKKLMLERKLHSSNLILLQRRQHLLRMTLSLKCEMGSI